MSLVTLTSSSLFAQVSGRVFEDLNANGKLDGLERGKAGISVKAYAYSQTLQQAQLLTQTRSDEQGYYELAVPEGQALRLVFDSEGYQSSPATPAVRFVRSPRTQVDYGFYTPTELVGELAEIVSPVYQHGLGQDTLSALSVLVTSKDSVYTLATPKQVGALWGVAFDADQQMLYASALAKRHAAYGPLGPGGIYRTDWQTKHTVPYLDLKRLGIPTGGDRHRLLADSLEKKSVDPDFMDQVGKVSLGGIDVLAGTLYVMNLTNRTLYAITLPSDTAARPNLKDLKAYALPSLECQGGDMRPFAVKAYQGKIYVGVVCDANLSQNLSDLSATVLVLDTLTAKFSSILSVPLNYTRGHVVDGLSLTTWSAWTDDFTKALHADFPSLATRPQPMLSSLAFDKEGALILGLMDRFGHQSGTGQPDPLGQRSYIGVAAGDVLRVYARTPQKRNLHYTLEANAQTGALRSLGSDNAQGPQGGEYYFSDHFAAQALTPRVIHEETGAGGVLYLPGREELLMTAHEPKEDFNTGGIKAFRLNEGSTSRGWNLFSDGQLGTFSKANGVGGLALISPQAEISLGDRMWMDTNADGIQDAEEDPLTGQLVELWQQGKKLAETVSDAEGRYSFSSTNVKGGLKARTAYEIRVPLSKELRVSQTRVGTDVEIDNDAIQKEGYALIMAQTKGSGEQLQHLDVGVVISAQTQSLTQAKEGSLRVYPNPVSRFVQVEAPARSQKAQLTITTLNGRPMIERMISARQGKFQLTLSLSDLPVGSYLLQLIETDQYHPPFKLVKD